jgi:MFS transporter
MSGQTNPMLLPPTRAGPHAGFFCGWWVVVACAVGLFFGPPVIVFSFPVFLKPLVQDFHAGRAAVSLGFTLQLIVVAVTAPVVGWLIDRYGSRKIILIFTSMFGVILILNRPISTDLSRFYFFCIALVLLCYKRRVQQKGQWGSWVRRKRAILIRRVAIEAGLCRSARARRTARLEVKRKLRGA